MKEKGWKNWPSQAKVLPVSICLSVCLSVNCGCLTKYVNCLKVCFKQRRDSERERGKECKGEGEAEKNGAEMRQ